MYRTERKPPHCTASSYSAKSQFSVQERGAVFDRRSDGRGSLEQVALQKRRADSPTQRLRTQNFCQTPLSYVLTPTCSNQGELFN